MKKFEFKEELKREDWEPLDGKWFSKNIYGDFSLYRVKLTDFGVLLYTISGVGCTGNEEYKSFGAYNENQLRYTNVKVFVDFYCDGILKEITEDDARFVLDKFKEKEAVSAEYANIDKERFEKMRAIDETIEKKFFSE